MLDVMKIYLLLERNGETLTGILAFEEEYMAYDEMNNLAKTNSKGNYAIIPMDYITKKRKRAKKVDKTLTELITESVPDAHRPPRTMRGPLYQASPWAQYQSPWALDSNEPA